MPWGCGHVLCEDDDRRVVFETLVSDISAYVTTVASGRLEEAIESALDAVRRFF
jgi:hypothetical protein